MHCSLAQHATAAATLCVCCLNVCLCVYVRVCVCISRGASDKQQQQQAGNNTPAAGSRGARRGSSGAAAAAAGGADEAAASSADGDAPPNFSLSSRTRDMLTTQQRLQDELTDELLDMGQELKSSTLAMQNAIRCGVCVCVSCRNGDGEGRVWARACDTAVKKRPAAGELGFLILSDRLPLSRCDMS